MIKASTTFLYEDDFVSFTADPGDVRSASIFFDDSSQTWCAGVTIRENYSKIRFDAEADARSFIKQLHAAKQAELTRLTTNADLREQRKVGA